eukprot:TRINITY_DN95224_c0_g1_i1.p1 TRINITY_DN95224_c0_g1~~TRINITY_DN95224_c0_g1_i1.p1  ORF type:complete len:168 (-),score=7.84 TRINITY_DN95224_c0_g1_i1:280-783(-)
MGCSASLPCCKCGAQLVAGSQYCPNCRFPVNAKDQNATVPAPPTGVWQAVGSKAQLDIEETVNSQHSSWRVTIPLCADVFNLSHKTPIVTKLGHLSLGQQVDIPVKGKGCIRLHFHTTDSSLLRAQHIDQHQEHGQLVEFRRVGAPYDPPRATCTTSTQTSETVLPQ